MRTVKTREIYRTGRLTAQPQNKSEWHETATGLQPVLLNQKKECLLYVPRSYNPHTPAALALMLHGAGGNAAHGLSYMQRHADEKNVILLSPASHDYSWDIIAGNSFGTDVIFIEHALSYVFERFHVNLLRIAIGGFSDGASYALCIGLSNGDLFTHIIAFSPGFYYTYENRGKPRVYISHGINDDVLPIGLCSWRIVPRLKQEGLALVYEEFNGRHEIPAPVAKGAVDWFVPSEAGT